MQHQAHGGIALPAWSWAAVTPVRLVRLDVHAFTDDFSPQHGLLASCAVLSQAVRFLMQNGITMQLCVSAPRDFCQTHVNPKVMVASTASRHNVKSCCQDEQARLKVGHLDTMHVCKMHVRDAGYLQNIEHG